VVPDTYEAVLYTAELVVYACLGNAVLAYGDCGFTRLDSATVKKATRGTDGFLVLALL
jgi:hypothetical protein